jgi:hypothetical protein
MRSGHLSGQLRGDALHPASNLHVGKSFDTHWNSHFVIPS